jgi:pantoate--beta-alanine ligase
MTILQFMSVAALLPQVGTIFAHHPTFGCMKPTLLLVVFYLGQYQFAKMTFGGNNLVQICQTVAQVRAAVGAFREAGETVGLVTTMGALHDGHLTLMRNAARDHDRVVATIFVNPTQFGQKADLAHYPSDDKRDIELLSGEKVDVIFMPEVEIIYPEGDETIVETTRMANMLHGLVRPGHFRGVATVVNRLFNIVGPDAAYFGEKDYQQLQVIKRMVHDLHMPLKIHGVPTVREADGLAMSSRNVRLSPDDRAAAVCISKALDAADRLATSGPSLIALDSEVRGIINSEPRASLRAIDIVEAESLKPIQGRVTGPTAIMISADFGGVLLIDQRVVGPA